MKMAAVICFTGSWRWKLLGIAHEQLAEALVQQVAAPILPGQGWDCVGDGIRFVLGVM